MDSGQTDQSISEYSNSICSHCGGVYEYLADKKGAVIACPHCAKLNRLQSVGSPSPKTKLNLTEKGKKVVKLVVCSLIALLFHFYFMPSEKEISENRAKLKEAGDQLSSFYSMPSSARDYSESLARSSGASTTKWVESQYDEALSKPRSFYTGPVIFWAIVSLAFCARAVYLIFWR